MKNPPPHGYRIYRHEPLSETFTRVMLELLHRTSTFSEHFSENPGFYTHEIRKCTKRMRALYKLFRPFMGNEKYMHGRQMYGKISELLSVYRVSAVHIDIMRRIATDRRLTVHPSFVETLIDNQTKLHDQLTREVLLETNSGLRIKSFIGEEINRMTIGFPGECKMTEVSGGFRKTYVQGCKSLSKVLTHTDAESLHELRKRVKATWNQLLLFRLVWPSVMRSSIHQFNLLAEKLGMDHDLAELERYLPVLASGVGQTSEPLLLYLTAKRKLLHKTIVPLATKLYAEKPGAFAGRMQKYYYEFVK